MLRQILKITLILLSCFVFTFIITSQNSISEQSLNWTKGSFSAPAADCAALSKDNSLFALSTSIETKIFNVATGKVIVAYPWKTDKYNEYKIAFSNDGSQLLKLDIDNIQVCNLDEVDKIEYLNISKNGNKFNPLAMTKPLKKDWLVLLGKWNGSTSLNTTFLIWDIKNDEIVKSFEIEGYYVSRPILEVSSTGKYIGVVDQDNYSLFTKIIDMENGEFYYSIGIYYSHMAFSNDDDYFVCSEMDRIDVYDLKNKEKEYTISAGFLSAFNKSPFSISKESNRIAYINPEDIYKINILDLETNMEIGSLNGMYAPNEIYFLNDNELLLAMIGNNLAANVFNLSSGQISSSIVNGSGMIVDIKMTKDNKYVIVFYQNNIVVIYDSKNGFPLSYISIPNASIGYGTLSVNNHSNRLGICARGHYNFFVQDISTLNGITKRISSEEKVNHVAFSDDGSRFAYGGEGGVIHFYNWANFSEIKTLDINQEVLFLSVLSDNSTVRVLYNLADEMEMLIWNTTTNSTIKRKLGSNISIFTSEIAESNNKIFYGTDKYIYNYIADEVNYYPDYAHYDSDISNDGKYTAQVSEIHKIGIFDNENQTYKTVIDLSNYLDYLGNFSKEFHYYLTSVAISPDSKTILAGLNDGSILSWDLGDLLTDVEETANVNDIQLYPNPTKDHLNIVIPNYSHRINSIDIYNLMGSKIQSLSATLALESEYQIDLGELPIGLYLIKVNYPEKSFSKTFIKK
jgi:WD40 repeat protein